MSQQVNVYRQLRFFNGGFKQLEVTPATTDNQGVAITQSLSSQTTENIGLTWTMTTDSTYLTGTNLTYSGARGSSILKLTPTWSGTSGGFVPLYINATKSGATSADGNGIMGLKCVVTNTGAMTDGEVYGGQFIAKHSHASNAMANSASLIGLEGWAYDAAAGTVGTLIGGNFGYHNESAGTKPTGSVHRGIQIFCDDASGADAADENEALCLWNMAGTQARAINIVQSGSGFTYFVRFASAAAPIAADTSNLPSAATYKIKCCCGSTDFYLIGVADF